MQQAATWLMLIVFSTRKSPVTKDNHEIISKIVFVYTEAFKICSSVLFSTCKFVKYKELTIKEFFPAVTTTLSVIFK